MPSYHPTNFRYIAHQENDNEVSSLGGDVHRFTAAGNLNVGDVVFLSAANTVQKSAVAADHDQVAGVVVGGTRTNLDVVTDLAAVATVQAAQVNEVVLVQVNGITRVVSGAAITIGQPLKPDTGTAGRAIAAVLGAGADQGKVFGRAVEIAGGAAVTIKVLLSLS